MAVSRKPQASGRWRRGRTPPATFLVLLPAVWSAFAGPISSLQGFLAGWSRPSLSSRASHQLSSLALRAEGEAVKDGNPVTTLQTAVRRAMRLRLGYNSSDVVYTYMTLQGSESEPEIMARVQFNCLEGQPSCTGSPQASEKLAKRAAAEAALSNPDLLLQMIMSSKGRKQKNPRGKSKNATVAAKKATATADAGISVDDDTGLSVDEPMEDSRIPVETLSLGQEITGTVTGRNNGGVYLDVGATVDAFLPVAEMCEGYPPEGKDFRKRGTKVTGRIVWKAEDGSRFWITRRSGDLTRPAKSADENFNGTAFKGVDTNTWFTGKVNGIYYDSAKIEVKDVPGGGPPVTANVRTVDFSEDFRSKAKVGMEVKVRKRFLTPSGRLDMSMLEATSVKLEAGAEVEGTVKNWLLRKRGDMLIGIFVDVGAQKDALLPLEEFNDGFPTNISSTIRRGSKIKARVLLVEDGNITLTRRSGDLARPPIQNYVNFNSIDHFKEVSSEEWLEGEVIRMLVAVNKNRPYRSQVMVNVTGPTPPRAAGRLMIKDTTEAFRAEAFRGMKIKVRVLKVDTEKKQMTLTMRDPSSQEESGEASTEEAVVEPTKEETGKEVVTEKEMAESTNEKTEDKEGDNEPPAESSPPPSPPPPSQPDLFSFLTR